MPGIGFILVWSFTTIMLNIIWRADTLSNVAIKIDRYLKARGQPTTKKRKKSKKDSD